MDDEKKKPSRVRPVGVTWVAALTGASGVINLAAGVQELALGRAVDAWLLLGSAALTFVLVAGLWRLQPWARTLTIVLAGLTLLLVGALAILGGPSNLVGIVLNLVIVMYLVGDPTVRAAFQRA